MPQEEIGSTVTRTLLVIVLGALALIGLLLALPCPATADPSPEAPAATPPAADDPNAAAQAEKSLRDMLGDDVELPQAEPR